MEKILLLGYFGAGNFGDEALACDWLLGHDEWLRQHGLKVDIITNGANPLDGFEEGESLKGHVGRLVPKEEALKLDPRDYRAMVAPGGSLLQDVTSLKSLLFYLLMVRKFVRAGRKVFMLNQGLGPIRTWLGRFLTRRYLGRATLLSLRDRASYDWAITSKLDRRTKVVLSADPILGSQLQGNPTDELCAVIIPKATGDLPTPLDKTTEAEAIARFTETCQRTTGLKVWLLPMHPADEAICQEVLGQSIQGVEMWQPACEFRYSGMWQLLASASLVVSYRLHGLVAAASSDRPAVGVAYDPKVEVFCSEMALPYCFPATIHEQSAAADLSRLWREREQVTEEMQSRKAKLLERLAESEAMFDDLW